VLVENVQVITESTDDEAVVELSHHFHPSEAVLHIISFQIDHFAQFQRQLRLHNTLGGIGTL